MSDFFDQIVYSAANEDPLSEIKGLKLHDNDRVLCVTGSGARVLDLLTQADCHITAVDFNVKQNYLLELKMAAYNHLDYEALLDFLGVTPCSHRADLFTKIKDDLGSDTALFWQEHPELISNGVLYQGVWERYMRSITQLLRLKKTTISKLFSCTSLEEQQFIWNHEWKTLSWTILMYLLGRRFIWKYIMKEPGIKYVHKDFDISRYMNERFERIANSQLFRFNPYLNLVFNGEYRDVLPLHLQEPSYNRIKNRLKQISVRHCSLQQILNESPNEFTAFSVSDFSSYSTREDYETTWEKIIYAAKPNAKFVERSFLVKYHLPNHILSNVIIDHQLSQELTQQDHSFIYDVRCGELT